MRLFKPIVQKWLDMSGLIEIEVCRAYLEFVCYLCESAFIWGAGVV